MANSIIQCYWCGRSFENGKNGGALAGYCSKACEHAREASMKSSSSSSSSSYTPSYPSKTYSPEVNRMFWLIVISIAVCSIVFLILLNLFLNITNLHPSSKVMLIIYGVWILIGTVILKTKGFDLKASVGFMAIVFAVSYFIRIPIENKFYNIPFMQKITNKSTVSAPAVPGKSSGKATVSAESANFRDKASTDSNVIQKVKKGDTLTVRGAAEGGWLPVEFNGKEGFISADLVTMSKE